MKKTYALLAYAILFTTIAASATAENSYRAFETGYPEADSILLYNFPVWIESNDTGTIYVTNVYSDTTNYAEITLGSGNATNMTYVASRNQFRTYVTSATEEDVNFTVQVKNSSGSVLANGTSVLKFRVPFTVTFNFYKNTNTTDTKVEKYDNEFQYAVLRYYAPGQKRTSYSLGAEEGKKFTAFLDKLLFFIPDYEYADPTTQIYVTDETYLFEKMSNGQAQIKVYQNGSYDLYIWNGDLYGGLTTLYEFGKPQRNGETEIRTVLAGYITIDNESNQAFGVYVSAWEVYKWHVVKNILWIVVITLAWAVLGVILAGAAASAAGSLLNDDMKTKAFGVILGVYAFGTSPLYIMALGLVL